MYNIYIINNSPYNVKIFENGSIKVSGQSVCIIKLKKKN